MPVGVLQEFDHAVFPWFCIPIELVHGELYAERARAQEGDTLINLVGGMHTERGVVMVLLLAGVAAVAGCLRGYLRHRTQLAMEQEMSTRTLARSVGLIHLAHGAHTEITIVERDRDGDRRIVARRATTDVEPDRQDLG